MPIRLGLFAVLLFSVPGCGMPWDPEDTLDNVRGQTLRVGVSHNPPWTDLRSGEEPTGVEVEMVREIAKSLGANVKWLPGGETHLLKELEEFEIDLVIGGLTDETPWEKRVGLSSPHTETDEASYVFAVPPGENGWIVFLDREIERIKTEKHSPEGPP
jgi:polar amino acid transport system substrate-binding protein